MKKLYPLLFRLATLIVALPLAISCKESAPPAKENIPETITRVTLTWTAVGKQPITATATDPDKQGPQDIRIDTDPIALEANATYELTIGLFNELYKSGTDGYDITKEVEEESHEHQFFFSWTNDVFSAPTGSGNIAARNGAVAYQDKDKEGLPLGLKTQWTTGPAGKQGDFRVVLKHQPNVKSANSSAQDGESDLDITFHIAAQ